MTDHAPETRIFQRCDTTARAPYARDEYIRRFAWEWVQRTFIRLSYRKAHRWRNFWARQFGAKIGVGSGFKSSTKITHPWLFSMGEHSMISEGVTIYNLGPITIGDHSVISQDAYLCAGTHDYTKPNLPLIRPTITVGSGVWICAGAFIGPGVTIGDNALIGARAVVMRDVPPGVIVAGNPAKVVRERPMPSDS